MTRRIAFTPPAQSQFLSALAYIRADRPSAARTFRDRSAKALSGLLDFPESGRVIPEFPSLGFREVLVESHRFFYKPAGDVIWVVGVWHDAQIPDGPSEPNGVQQARETGSPIRRESSDSEGRRRRSGADLHRGHAGLEDRRRTPLGCDHCAFGS